MYSFLHYATKYNENFVGDICKKNKIERERMEAIKNSLRSMLHFDISRVYKFKTYILRISRLIKLYIIRILYYKEFLWSQDRKKFTEIYFLDGL